MSQQKKTLLIWVVLVVMMVAIYQVSDEPGQWVEFGDFMTRLDEEPIREVRVETGRGTAVLTAWLPSGEAIRSRGIVGERFPMFLREREIPFRVVEAPDPGYWVASFPAILMVLMFFFFMRQLTKKTGVADDFKKAPIERLDTAELRVSMKDIGGCFEAKRELQALSSALRVRGTGYPKGVLIAGPTGTGKSKLARAFALDLGRPVFAMPGAMCLDMFVGTGAARIRDLFDKAEKEAPAVILIDDIDAFARRRGDQGGFQGGEREHAVSQILDSLDRRSSAENRVVLVAVSNRPDLLDEALLRSGRIDVTVRTSLPSREERLEIIGVHAKAQDTFSRDELADASDGLHGADLEWILTDARMQTGVAHPASVQEALQRRKRRTEISPA